MEKKKAKEEKYKIVEEKKFQKIMMHVSLVIGLIFLVLLTLSLVNHLFVPSAIICFSLFLFSICFCYYEDKDKKKLVYGLFAIGVLLVLIEVIYTIVNII